MSKPLLMPTACLEGISDTVPEIMRWAMEGSTMSLPRHLQTDQQIGDLGLITLSLALLITAVAVDRNPVAVLKTVIAAVENGTITIKD